jgi:hypothetical protein
MTENGAFRGAQSAISPSSEPIAVDSNTPACQPLRLRSPAAAPGDSPVRSVVGRHVSKVGARNGVWREVRLAIVPLLSRVARLGNSLGARWLALRVGVGAPKESPFQPALAEVISCRRPLAHPFVRAHRHQATAPRAPLNEDERVKVLFPLGLRRRHPGARSEICSSSVVLVRPWSALF